jgi:hypothetical protein
MSKVKTAHLVYVNKDPIKDGAECGYKFTRKPKRLKDYNGKAVKCPKCLSKTAP